MIHEIRIQNFKSIQDVTVEFSDVTVLVGRSGTGKSNFVEAVRFLRDLLRKQSAELAGVRPFPKQRNPSF
ncbi:MAG: AAA family ATPase [Pirellulaceae bacterium]